MNSPKAAAVERLDSRWRPLGVVGRYLATCIVFLTSCVDIQGGAVEASWSLRRFDGQSVDSCAIAGVDRVRICWQSIGDGGQGGGRCRPGQYRSFPCDDESGASLFEIPPGPTAIWLEPVCEDQLPPLPGTYEVPPPIVRDLEEGKVATLQSLLIVVTDAESCQPAGCTCQRP